VWTIIATREDRKEVRSLAPRLFRTTCGSKSARKLTGLRSLANFAGLFQVGTTEETDGRIIGVVAALKREEAKLIKHLTDIRGAISSLEFGGAPQLDLMVVRGQAQEWPEVRGGSQCSAQTNGFGGPTEGAIIEEEGLGKEEGRRKERKEVEGLPLSTPLVEARQITTSAVAGIYRDLLVAYGEQVAESRSAW